MPVATPGEQEPGVSRIPVYRGDLDHMEGIVHVKDILHALKGI